MDYCGECQTAIDNALGKIKVKFEPKFVEIKPTFGLPELLAGIKAEHNRKVEGSDTPWPTIVCLNLPDCDYDNVEEYTHNGKTFRIAWDDFKENDRHYFVQMEYDIAKKDVTQKTWDAKSYKDSYRCGKSSKHFFKKMCEATNEIFGTHPMELPKGNLFFLDFPSEWEIQTPKLEKKKPEHKQREYTIEYSGSMLKSFAKDGRNSIDGKITAVPPAWYNEEDVCDALEYKISISKYDDENVETITDIKVK
jgi:hypothetical protein